MNKKLRLILLCFLVFFGSKTFAQQSTNGFEKSTNKLKHIETKNLILAIPTSVVKHEETGTKFPEKPKKEKKQKEKKGVKPPKINPKQAIIDEKNNPK
ncbi:MAG: hypothetical protein H8E84_06185 [Flavobacteriales bacterium]|nr:hypothetical protein [Flavobacteriales bacterium]